MRDSDRRSDSEHTKHELIEKKTDDPGPRDVCNVHVPILTVPLFICA
jgi:hypothetical protein